MYFGLKNACQHNMCFFKMDNLSVWQCNINDLSDSQLVGFLSVLLSNELYFYEEICLALA